MAVDAVSQRVSALESRVSACESKTAKIGDGVTLGVGDDVDERLSKIEKALKVAKRRATTGR
jgi:hypothetical protein